MGAPDSPSRRYFRDFLDANIPKDALIGKDVLDVGCGVGYLWDWLRSCEIKSVTGFDPSQANIAEARKRNPWVKAEVATLEEFAAMKHGVFDVALAVMVFEHITDLSGAFRDIKSLLNSSGHFYLLIGDKDFHISKNYEIKSGVVDVQVLQELGEGTVEVRTLRSLGNGITSTMYDIFRPLSQVFEAARANGFELCTTRPLFNRNAQHKDVVICHLLHFSRTVD